MEQDGIGRRVGYYRLLQPPGILMLGPGVEEEGGGGELVILAGGNWRRWGGII